MSFETPQFNEEESESNASKRESVPNFAKKEMETLDRLVLEMLPEEKEGIDVPRYGESERDRVERWLKTHPRAGKVLKAAAFATELTNFHKEGDIT